MTAVPMATGRFTCPVCARRFHELAAKKTHIKLKHPRKRKNGAS